MLKLIGISMLTCIALFPVPGHAQTMQLTLAPKESKIISNDYMWTINATCTIQTNRSSKTIVINALKNNSTVNGKHLTSGQKTTVPVQDNQNITVTAEPGAKVIIKNSSVETVTASCSS